MFSKVFILCAVFAAAHANALWGAPLISTGVSKSSRQQDAHGNYAFGYDIVDGKGATNSRAEVGDGAGNKKGSYSLTDIDGRARRVDYVADGHGFRVAVKTNEPGTAKSAPAAAVIASPYAAPAAPVVGHASVLAVPVSAYSTAIGHGASIGHGAILGSPLGLGVLGNGLGGLGGYGLGGLGGYGLGGLGGHGGLGGLGLAKSGVW